MRGSQVTAQPAGPVESVGKALHGRETAAFELGDDRQGIGLNPGQTREVAYQDGIRCPDPGSGHDDLVVQEGVFG